MRNLSESDARYLLKPLTRAVGAGAWTRSKIHPGTDLFAAGLVDENEVPLALEVELKCIRHQTAGKRRFVFSVFKREKYGLEIVYQLDVTQSARPLKDMHRKPHEHMGVRRTVGAADWREWGYDEVLAYFCEQTHIVFDDAPVPPENR